MLLLMSCGKSLCTQKLLFKKYFLCRGIPRKDLKITRQNQVRTLKLRPHGSCRLEKSVHFPMVWRTVTSHFLQLLSFSKIPKYFPHTVRDWGNHRLFKVLYFGGTTNAAFRVHCSVAQWSGNEAWKEKSLLPYGLEPQKGSEAASYKYWTAVLTPLFDTFGHQSKPWKLGLPQPLFLQPQGRLQFWPLMLHHKAAWVLFISWPHV